MDAPIFHGKIVKNKLVLLNHVRKAIALWCCTFRDGTRVDVIIRKHKAARTNAQNAYYWGVVVKVLADFFGYDPEEMHMALREKFLRVFDEDHPDLVFAKSTTKLSTMEFVEYIERIQRWAATEYQIYIPDPEGVDYENFSA